MSRRGLGKGGLDGALARYRLMAFVVGTMLLFLCVVALPLQYVWGRPAVADVGFTIHGIVYIVYLLSVAALARHARLRTLQVVGLVCAGFVPGLAFYVERRTTKSINPRRLAPATSRPVARQPG